MKEDAGVEEGIRYAHNGGVAIAYQIVGQGEVDLVYVPDWMSNLVYGWESPRWRAFYEHRPGSRVGLRAHLRRPRQATTQGRSRTWQLYAATRDAPGGDPRP